MPVARAISASSMAARIIAPSLVRSWKIHSASPTTMPTAITKSRYDGKIIPAKRTDDDRPSGLGSWVGVPPQIHSETSPTISRMPKVMSAWGSSSCWGSRRRTKRSITTPSATPRATAATVASAKLAVACRTESPT